MHRKSLMCGFHASSECSVRNKTIISSALVLVYDADMDTGALGRFPLNLFPSENLIFCKKLLFKGAHGLKYDVFQVNSCVNCLRENETSDQKYGNNKKTSQ